FLERRGPRCGSAPLQKSKAIGVKTRLGRRRAAPARPIPRDASATREGNDQNAGRAPETPPRRGAWTQGLGIGSGGGAQSGIGGYCLWCLGQSCRAPTSGTSAPQAVSKPQSQAGSLKRCCPAL